MTSLAVTGWAVLCALPACAVDNGDGGGVGPACMPGERLACACDSGGTGTILCEEFSMGAGTCECEAVPVSGGAGGMGATGGTGGLSGTGGMTMVGSGGNGGLSGVGGMAVTGGTGGSSGMSGGSSGMGGGASGASAGASGEGGASGTGGDPGAGETGALVGFTAAHNAKRAMVDTTPALGDLMWDPEISVVAQDWADTLAAGCAQVPMHRPPPRQYGENIAAYFSSASGQIGSPQAVVDGWYGEIDCWTYGTIGGSEICNMTCTTAMFSSGCGHYTQVVWRDTERVGCGYASCSSGGEHREYWVCNYDPPGNWLGDPPY